MKRILSMVFALVCFVSVAFAQPQPPGASEAESASLQEWLSYVDIQVLVHRYPETERLLDSLSRAHPGEPGVAFRRAVLYFTWVDDYGIRDSLETHFSAAIDSTVAFAERAIRERPDDPWGHYYLGSALVYDAFYRSVNEGVTLRTVPSLISTAARGIGHLQQAHRIDTSLADVTFAIGKYHQWRGRHLPWPLGGDGEARRGVAMMERAITGEITSREGALQAMAWVYLEEERYEDATRLLAPLRERYPSSRLLGDPAGRALARMEEWVEVEEVYRGLAEHASERDMHRPAVVVQIERWIALARSARGDCESALTITRRLRGLDYRGVDERWLGMKLGTVGMVEERCR